MTPICTPTKNREEFESILRELDPVGVKWICGGEKPLDWANTIAPYLCYEDLEIYQGYSVEIEGLKILPRAEFVAAIKKDFALKIDCSYPTDFKEEKPIMNYNKMLKRELVDELKDRDELQNKVHEINNNWGKDRMYRKSTIDDLEKTSAEQAETIKELKTYLAESGQRTMEWKRVALETLTLFRRWSNAQEAPNE